MALLIAATTVATATAQAQGDGKKEYVTIITGSLCEKQEQQLAACEQTLLLADHLIKNQAEVINTQDRQVTELETMLHEAHVELERKDAWYQSKEFWFAVGIVSGAAIGVQL